MRMTVVLICSWPRCAPTELEGGLQRLAAAGRALYSLCQAADVPQQDAETMHASLQRSKSRPLLLDILIEDLLAASMHAQPLARPQPEGDGQGSQQAAEQLLGSRWRVWQELVEWAAPEGFLVTAPAIAGEAGSSASSMRPTHAASSLESFCGAYACPLPGTFSFQSAHAASISCKLPRFSAVMLGANRF